MRWIHCLVVMIMCSLVVAQSGMTSPRDCTAADVGFIFDSSGSVGKINFQKELDFGKSVATLINAGNGGGRISHDNIRIASVTYSSRVTANFALGVKTSLGQLTGPDGFDANTYLGKRTASGDALAEMRDIMNPRNGRGGRPDIPKVIVIITDGMSNEGQAVGPIAREVANMGIKVIAVGVGRAVRRELLVLANGVQRCVRQLTDFQGLSSIIQPIAEQVCEIDGNWSEWGQWSDCDANCGGGARTRARTCTNPAPRNGGKDCEGSSSDTGTCNTNPCPTTGPPPIDGDWSGWSQWSTCSASCDGGSQTRSRTCTSPSPQNGGSDCVGSSSQGRSCNTDPCQTVPPPIDGNWTGWGSWSSCSVSCEGGTQTRSRSCTNPPPQNGGRDCEGDGSQTRACNTGACKAECAWSYWSSWGFCSQGCGGGTHVRTRTCNNPYVENCQCPGDYMESQTCNPQDCPINGEWTPWGSWEDCSRTCDAGLSKRRRSCSNPAPSNNGLPCTGDAIDYRICNTHTCSVDGGWSTWSDGSGCTKSCGYGLSIRERRCNSPIPAGGGSDCIGPSAQISSCANSSCPVDGGWGEWCCAWNQCSRTCGTGTQTRTRRCNSPTPAGGGAPCQGENEQSQSCNTQPCPVDGNWGTWQSSSDCSVTCGTGYQTRERACNNPPAQNGGRPCDKRDGSEKRTCKQACCNPKTFPTHPFFCNTKMLVLSCGYHGTLEMFGACTEASVRKCGDARPDIFAKVKGICDGKSTCQVQNPCGDGDNSKLLLQYRCCTKSNFHGSYTFSAMHGDSGRK